MGAVNALHLEVHLEAHVLHAFLLIQAGHQDIHVQIA